MNKIGKRCSHNLCIRLMILVILRGKMFLFFLNKKNSFEYNMANLVALGTPVAKLKAVHNCAKAAKQDSNDAMGLRSVLYLLKVLRSCLHQIYGLMQVYTTALKDNLYILYTNMIMA